MFAKRLSELAKQKRLLMDESAIHRGLVEVEWTGLCARVGSARAAIRPDNPWVAAGGLTAALLAARRRRGLALLVPAGWALWKLWRRKKPGAD